MYSLQQNCFIRTLYVIWVTTNQQNETQTHIGVFDWSFCQNLLDDDYL